MSTEVSESVIQSQSLRSTNINKESSDELRELLDYKFRSARQIFKELTEFMWVWYHKLNEYLDRHE